MKRLDTGGHTYVVEPVAGGECRTVNRSELLDSRELVADVASDNNQDRTTEMHQQTQNFSLGEDSEDDWEDGVYVMLTPKIAPRNSEPIPTAEEGAKESQDPTTIPRSGGCDLEESADDALPDVQLLEDPVGIGNKTVTKLPKGTPDDLETTPSSPMNNEETEVTLPPGIPNERESDNSVPASCLDSGNQNEVEITGVVPEEEPSDINYTILTTQLWHMD